MMYDFEECLAYSKGMQQKNEIETIRTMVSGCVSCEATSLEEDKSGTDYIATLRGGRRVNIDAKMRSQGASRYWHGEPDLALEDWSVLPGGKFNIPKDRAKVGWTLSEASNSELILFTFHPSDCKDAYLFPFQHLRMAFRAWYKVWMERYKIDVQESGRNGLKWQSRCVFVPYSEVWNAIQDSGRGQLRIVVTNGDGQVKQGFLF